MSTDPWGRVVNPDGDTVADATLTALEAIHNERLGGVLAYLDLIAECVVTLAWSVDHDAGRRHARLSEIRQGETGRPAR